MIAIDSHVPPPRLGRTPLYPWEGMQPGDSFFVPGITASKLSGAAHRQRRKYGGRYTCRRATVDGVAGARCWRVE